MCILTAFIFSRKLLGWNQWSLYLGYSISFGLSLIGNFQLHSVRTAGKNSTYLLLYHLSDRPSPIYSTISLHNTQGGKLLLPIWACKFWIPSYLLCKLTYLIMEAKNSSDYSFVFIFESTYLNFFLDIIAFIESKHFLYKCLPDLKLKSNQIMNQNSKLIN